jgi:cytochrome b6-f complex iron-sulfur subunit
MRKRREDRRTAPREHSPAAETAAPATPGDTRRRFLWQVWLALAGVAVLEGIWIVFDFLRPRSQETAGGKTIVVAGPVDQFEPGSVTAFPEGRFYLTRLADGGFLALSRQCTHLGCTVPWEADQGRFLCPCHASAFDQRGDVLSPPAPRALDLFPIRIENDVVKVDVGSPQRRSAFRPDQVTRA